MSSKSSARLALLALATVSACGVVYVAPTLWADPAEAPGEAFALPLAADCTDQGGTVETDPANCDLTDAAATIWVADADSDSELHVEFCCCQDGTDCKAGEAAPGGFTTQNETITLADLSDCDDDNGLVNTGAVELCDGIDNDCDGDVDEGFTLAQWYPDVDEDGFGDGEETPTLACASARGPGVAGLVKNGEDCDDADDEVFPGAVEDVGGVDKDCDGGVSTAGGPVELCDGIDNDGDGTVDEGFPKGARFPDVDGDGFGDENASSANVCVFADGWVDNDDDCDDAHPLKGGTASEPGNANDPGNGRDDDCNGDFDFDGGSPVTYGRDQDGDGYYVTATTIVVLQTVAVDAALAEYDWYPVGTLDGDDDCDDADPLSNPGMAEICNDGADNDCDGDATTTDASGEVEVCDGFDNDCDGEIDNGLTLDNAVGAYADLDRDGQGDPNYPIDSACTALSFPTVATIGAGTTDCDDTNPDVKEGLVETCGADGLGDGIDNDCNGYVDNDALINGTATEDAEACDGIDNDCDGTPDNGLTLADFLPDRDLDGDADSTATAVDFCDGAIVEFYVQTATGTDCDDDNPAVPVADGSDNDCDGVDDDCDGTADEDILTDTNSAFTYGSWYRDLDGDTFGSAASATPIQACLQLSSNHPSVTGYVTNNSDCVDTVAGQVRAGLPATTQNRIGGALIHPNATETWYDDIDQNCDGKNDYDQDQDGYASIAEIATDVAAGNTNGVPWAYATSRSVTVMDAGASRTTPGTDCADVNRTTAEGNTFQANLINPGVLLADETWYDDVDENCDNQNDYDQDQDGYADKTAILSDEALPSPWTYNTSLSKQLENLPATDCGDAAAVGGVAPNLIFPGAVDDGTAVVDRNCDGVQGTDADGDGVPSVTTGGTDCYDADPTPFFTGKANRVNVRGAWVRPAAGNFPASNVNAATETWYDDVDSNCDGQNDFDRDGDNFASEAQVAAFSGYNTGWSNTTDPLPTTDCNDDPAGETNALGSNPGPNPIPGNLIYPGAPDNNAAEQVDRNCDGVPGVDEDGDGYASVATGGDDCVDLPAGVPDNQNNLVPGAQINPGAAETCGNGVNEDCFGAADQGPAELCDGFDNDCQNGVDDGFARTTFYEDADGDGFGDPTAPYAIQICAQADFAGYAANDDDCDDTDPNINPDALEVCGDGEDNDCDGQVDTSAGGVEIACNGLDDNCNNQVDETAIERKPFYRDNDGDGYGASNDASPVTACAQATIPGRVPNNGDCNDSNPAVNPGVAEICNDGINNDCSTSTTDSVGMGFEVCDGYDNDCDVGGVADNGLHLVTFYTDNDGDGYGSTNQPVGQFCYDAQRPGMSRVGGDCNDTPGVGASINPGAFEVCGDGLDNDCQGGADNGTERCNGVDDNCNNQRDEGFTRVAWYPDADRDGFGAGLDPSILACPTASPSAFGSIWRSLNGLDCDDFRADVNPDAVELPGDGVDNDCDFMIDQIDSDGCDGVDNDGDGQIDEDIAGVRVPFYPDLDGDGYAAEDPSDFVLACKDAIIPGRAPIDSTLFPEDCNDLDATVSPGAPEVCGPTGSGDGVDNDCDGDVDDDDGEECDGLDNDCDGVIDNGLVRRTFGPDTDKDGYGNGTSPSAFLACEDAEIPGFAVVNDSRPTDCDDRSSQVNPGAFEVCGDNRDNDCLGGVNNGTEVCNGVDDNCNSIVDDVPSQSLVTWYPDRDGDGVGDANGPTLQACAQNFTRPGYTQTPGDCSDADAAVKPGAAEACNGLDDDCDNQIDDNDPDVNNHPSSVWYTDDDRDGYGNATAIVTRCAKPNNRSSKNRTDCLDTGTRTPAGGGAAIVAANINPGVTEVWYNDVDQDCSNGNDYDQDGDGFASIIEVANDFANTAAYEASRSYVRLAIPATDCEDAAPVITVNGPVAPEDINPDAPDDIPYDGVNQTCRLEVDGVTVASDFDQDGDGFSDIDEVADYEDLGFTYVGPPATDCDDTDEGISPAAQEVCFDLVDNNCSGEQDEPGNVFPFSPAEAWYPDVDGDLYGDPDRELWACVDPSPYDDGLGDGAQTYVQDDSDCTDDPAGVTLRGVTILGEDINVDQTEIWYDGIIKDCDTFDDFDQDGDGHASIAMVQAFFSGPGDPTGEGGYQLAGGSLPVDDCVDSVAEVNASHVANDADADLIALSDADKLIIAAASHPGVSGEQCDSVDNDCNGQVDENVTNRDFYRDRDGDGFGVPTETDFFCRARPGYVSNNTDCVDAADVTRAGVTVLARNIYPGATDAPYDGIDANCLGNNDFDRDGDQFASQAAVERFESSCASNSPPCGGVYANTPNATLPPTDCNDDPAQQGALQNPAQVDTTSLGYDANCDGTFGVDQDGDLVASEASGGTDCYDDVAEVVTTADRRREFSPEEVHGRNNTPGDPNRNTPAATEIWYDDVDSNCDNINDFDQDGDGFASTQDVLDLSNADPNWNYALSWSRASQTLEDSDCVDLPAGITSAITTIAGVNIRPGVTDAPYDNIDQDCDLANDFDVDRDGFASTTRVDQYNALADGLGLPHYDGSVVPSGDCADDNPARNPGEDDTVDNLIDNNCDGVPGVDADRDGRPSIASGGADCDDTNALAYPGNIEVCEVGAPQQIDNDCDGNPNTLDGAYSNSPTSPAGVSANTRWYLDLDGDGEGGQGGQPFYLCDRLAEPNPQRFADNANDCNDANDTVKTGAEEQCNGADDNCNGVIDEPRRFREQQPSGSAPFYRDADQDGYGPVSGEVMYICSLYDNQINRIELCGNPDMDPLTWGIEFPAGSGTCWSRYSTDCDDVQATYYPRSGEAFFERIDGVDNDCNGQIPIIEVDCDNDGAFPMLPTPNGEFTGNFTSAEEIGLTSCVDVPTPPEVSCLDATRVPACDPNTGLWVLGTVPLVDEGWMTAATRVPDPVLDRTCGFWDCDDTADLRCVRSREDCDGVDNDCNSALELGNNLDANENGLPDLMEAELEIPGFVIEDEVDFDGDNQLACASGTVVGGNQTAITYRGNDAYVTPGNDCNNQCVLLFNEVELTACGGYAVSGCETWVEPFEGQETTEGNGNWVVDRDNDGYRICGAFGFEDAELLDEKIYTLVYADDLTFDDDTADTEEPEELWNIVPLVYPRAEGGDVGTEPVACDEAHWDKLNELTGLPNVLDVFAEDRQRSRDLGPLLEVCIEADTCRELRERGAAELPEYCDEHENARCAIVELTVNSEADEGLFQKEFPGCLESAGDAWYPEQAITRSVWSKERIVQARRLVVEWECYRSLGTFGCGGADDLTVPEGWESVYDNEIAPRPGGFVDDLTWRTVRKAALQSNPELDLFFNRYDPNTVAQDGLFLGCWGDPTSGGVDAVRDFDHVGGDCNDDPNADGALAQRGSYEGPGDLLGVFDGEPVDCSVCTDGIDNNCNGLPDCAEPACARCFVGQGVGCGADTCSSGGCTSQGRGARGITGTGAGFLFLLMVGMGWRRRSER